MTMKLLIVDDEPHARSALVQLCERAHDVRVVGEAESGIAGIDAAEKLRPDVMLVDVELPDMTGFDVLRGARTRRQPLGIMVTTHAEHAATAFAEGALDYLVKPVSAGRFAESMERARQRCNPVRLPGESANGAESRRMGQVSGFAAAPFKLLMGEREHRLYPLNAGEVEYIESDGNYVTIRSGNSKYISRDSIKRLAAELADIGFIRIERSLLVNIRAVEFVESVGRGTFAFTLSSGPRLRSSASYRDSILRVLPMRRLANCRI